MLTHYTTFETTRLLKQLTSGKVFPGLAPAFALLLSYSALGFVEKSRFIQLTNHSLLIIIVIKILLITVFPPLAAASRFYFFEISRHFLGQK